MSHVRGLGMFFRGETGKTCQIKEDSNCFGLCVNDVAFKASRLPAYFFAESLLLVA